MADEASNAQINLAVIGGDGIGPEVVAEGLKVLDAVSSAKVERTEYDLGARRWHATGETLPDSVLGELRGHDAILLGAVGVAIWTFVFFDLIATKDETKIVLAVIVGLVLHALMYSPQAAFFSELFGTTVRYTGASVGYQLASIFAGALAPIIALKLLGDDLASPDTFAVGVYVAIASVITVVSVLLAKETRATSLRHDRVVPEAH